MSEIVRRIGEKVVEELAVHGVKKLANTETAKKLAKGAKQVGTNEPRHFNVQSLWSLE